MNGKKSEINCNKAKQIFFRLAQQLPSKDEIIPLPGYPGQPITLREPFMIRGGMMLRGAIAGAYFEAAEELNKIILKNEAWNSDAVEDLLAGCIAKVFEAMPDQRLRITQEQAKEFVQGLKRSPEAWDIELEIFGIRPECAGIKFGQITFNYEVVPCEIPIPGFPNPPSEHPVCFANLSVEAISRRAAIDRAESVIDRHLAVLNTVCAQFVRPPVHLSRFPQMFQARTAYKSKGPEETPANAQFAFRNIAIPLSRSDLIATLERDGGKVISELLTREGSFADRLISAYEIAGTAHVERLPHISFLLFAIALESAVLGRNTKSELNFQLSARVAHIHARNIESRRRLSDTINDLYDLRSKIVHTASSDVSTDQLRTLTVICLGTLHALVAAPWFRNMKEASELDDWFDKRLLGDTEPLPEW
jgi:hypothetical protein